MKVYLPGLKRYLVSGTAPAPAVASSEATAVLAPLQALALGAAPIVVPKPAVKAPPPPPTIFPHNATQVK